MTYRLTGRKSLRRPDEIIEPGTEFEPTEAELKSFGDKLEKVESDASHDDPEEPDADEKYTCAGKDGQCSRTVDEPGGFCWQHR